GDVFEAIIFDFDGLILETETPVWSSWRAIYQEHGHDVPVEDWIACLGRSSEYSDFHGKLERLTGRSLDRGALKQRRTEMVMARLVEQPPQPGVVDWLDAAARRGLMLAVASGSSHRWVEGHLERLGVIGRFHTIVCADDTERHKPDPAPFTLAAEKLSVPPGRCIVLEDSPNGITAAKAAGMTAVAVPTEMTAPLAFDNADWRIDSLADVTLDELLGRAAQVPR
ncbi:MAG: HAD family hydrolase, partial [Phycisphaerae bacterium]|nr:HAD family hydrolase [Phycisphaerae bacterium]